MACGMTETSKIRLKVSGSITTADSNKLEHGQDVGSFVLVFGLSLVWGWRTVMFQLSGLYWKGMAFGISET